MAAGMGRACVGLGLSGQGLAILSGVVPHEDPLVGCGLLAFGGVLMLTGRLPAFPFLRRVHFVCLGGIILGVVALASAVTRTAPVGPLLVMALLGAALLAAGLVAGHRVHFGRHEVAVRDMAACAAVAVGVPVGFWLAQAAFKRFSGATPLEAFEMLFLVWPVHWVLGRVGLPTVMDHQTLTLAGPMGPLAVQVGVACSGLQAMALFLALLALFAAAIRPSAARLAVWSGVGLFGVYVANLMRLTVILLSGHWWGAAALEGVHANAGWAFFVAWTWAFALWVKRDLRRATAPPPTPS
ncbi:MAG: exosortase/archaeosortase family protein [Thermoplasmatota archaeon]